MNHFADRLLQVIRHSGHPLCVGLDPHLPLIPKPFRVGDMQPGQAQTAQAVEQFLLAVLDQLVGKVGVIKPQIAFFEQLGWRGIQVLERIVSQARQRGLLVILDAKRGDIGSTAQAYSAAYLQAGACMEVDALTVNPYLGMDSLEPFVQNCVTYGKGLFVLVKTSNPGSGDFQDGLLQNGLQVYQNVAHHLAQYTSMLASPKSGWSGLGIVVGATFPGQAEDLRRQLPHSFFLIPGYGAQGASAKQATQGMIAGPNGLEGGVINASRAILYPARLSLSCTVTAWEQAIEQAITHAILDLKQAIA